MTVHQLRPAAVAPDVAAARAAVAAASAVPLGRVAREELGVLVAELTGLAAQVEALRLGVLAEADRRRVAEDTAASGTDAWAAKLTGTSKAVMAGGLRLARLLEQRYAHTRVAFAAGRIGVEQVRVIVNAAERLPVVVTDAQRAHAEAGLVAKAVAGMNPRRLRVAARRMLEDIDKQLADEHEAGELDRENRRAQEETWLRLHDNGDGTVTGRFTIPELHAGLLRAALERLSAPRRLAVNKAGRVVTDPTLPGEGPTLSYPEALGAAFCEVLEHLPTTGHDAVAVSLLVKLDYTALIADLGAARIDTHVQIAPSQARRLACNAGIVPMVFAGASEPLDVGRERRLHTKAMRRALSWEYDTCAAEGCERPFAWCDIHHPQPWAKGGPTSRKNAIPLCGWHHHRAHDNRYTMRILPTGEARFRRRP